MQPHTSSRRVSVIPSDHTECAFLAGERWWAGGLSGSEPQRHLDSTPGTLVHKWKAQFAFGCPSGSLHGMGREGKGRGKGVWAGLAAWVLGGATSGIAACARDRRPLVPLTYRPYSPLPMIVDLNANVAPPASEASKERHDGSRS